MDVRYSGYRSRGSVNNRGIFDFEDEFGNDPLLTRYSSSSGARDLSNARAERSASDVALAKASLDAVTMPVKTMASFLTDINNTVKQQEDMYRTARMSGQMAQLRPLLEKAATLEDLNTLRANPNYSDAWSDDSLLTSLEAKKSAILGRDLAAYQSRLNSATTPEEIATINASLPIELYANPDISRNIGLLTTAATAKVGAMRAAQARAALGGAATTDQMLRAQELFGDVLTDPGVQAAAERNEKQLQLEQNLRSAGIDPARFATRTGPDGTELGYDYEAANLVLDAQYSPQDVRTIQGAITNKMRQLGDIQDPADPRAQQIQTEIDDLNNSLTSALMQQDRKAAVAQGVLQSKGATVPDWVDTMINGGSAVNQGAPAAAPASAPAPAPAPADNKPAPKAAEEPKPDSRVTEADQTVAQAREESGLAQQPWGIRQINEALSVDNADVRKKAAKATEVKKRLDPYADEDLRDPQAIQAALRVVYPEIGEESNRFDVGNADDPDVVFAAEYLQRVEPSLLKAIAASPGRGGRRGSLTFQELPELAKRAKSVRSKIRTGSPRGSRE